MLTAMLVDDEDLSIRMLESIVDWKGCGVEIVASAQNGQEGLEKFRQYHPHIIVTDIKMPNMNGLEFIRQVKETEPATEFILVSAYADFDFVKKAIEMGCSNYILKPVDEYELETTLKKLTSKISNQRAAEKIVEGSRRQKDARSLYYYMKSGSNQVAAQKSVVSMGLNLSHFALMCFILNDTSINDYIENSQQLDAQMPFIIEHMAAKLDCWGRNLLFEYEDFAWTAILVDCSQQMLPNYAREMIAFFQEDLHMKVNVCFTEPASRLEQLPQSFKRLSQLSRYSFFIGEETMLGYGYNCVESELNQVAMLDYSKSIETAIRQGNREKALELLGEVLGSSYQTDPSSLHLFYEFCYNAVRAVREKLQQDKKINQQNQYLLQVCYQDLAVLYTIEELQTYTVRALEWIGEDGACTRREYSALVEHGIRYLEENFDRNLSLEEICSHLNVSKNYFCYLFKKETGENLWAYLTQIRLNKAKELLRTTQEKTYAIAYQVGYDNPSYFSKLFKKCIGKSPSEYRAEI